MGDIFSSVRLKEKVLIITLTLVAAVFVGVIAGAVTFATTDRHVHEYEYHLERGSDGKFDFVGVCTYAECTNPRFVRNINSGVTNNVKTPATCTSTGVMEFYFTYGENDGKAKTYTYTEEIPMESHAYVGEIVTVDGVTSIKGTCVYDDCNAPEINIEGATDLKLESTAEGSCSTPNKDIYSYNLDGSKQMITMQSSTNAPHKLNGKYISEYEIEEGVYLFGTDGIVLVGVPTLGCGNKGPGYFICQDCGKAIAIMVGRPDHNFVLTDSGITQPTMLADGFANLKCTAEGCEQTKRIVLPKAVVDENAEVIYRNCAEGKQLLNYTYFEEEYGVEVNLSLTLPWNEHSYAYIESETKNPSLERDGYAVVRCTAEGCTSSNRIVLNKITLDGDRKNAEVISEATEQTLKQILYTYTSETYGFTVELQIGVGDLLTHKYVYELEPISSDDPSQMLTFDLVGRCHQAECLQPEIREVNVHVESRDTSTCQQMGELIYTHTTESGEVYEFSIFIGLGTHNVVKLSEITNPDFFNEGSVTVGCTHEGCPYSEVVVALPVIEIGVNASKLEDGHILYIYHYEPLGYDIALTLTVTVAQE